MNESPSPFGLFLRQDDRKSYPGLLVLGGSEGGIPAHLARFFAAEGFAVLACGYHGCEELPKFLVEIPLERVREALAWLTSQAGVHAEGGRVGAVGMSKGGELVLLAASTFPDLIGPVVAYTPSSVVWQGLGVAFWRPRSSWSFAGRPLPFVPFGAAMPKTSRKGVVVHHFYEKGLGDTARVLEAAIEVERAQGPLLLVSGGDDHMWPAGRMCQMITDRLAEHGRDDVRHLDFPAAGHMLVPYDPNFRAKDAPRWRTAIPRYDLGGSPQAAEEAHERAWPTVIDFLHEGRI